MARRNGNPLAPVGLLLVLNAIGGAVGWVIKRLWNGKSTEPEKNDAEHWRTPESFE